MTTNNYHQLLNNVKNAIISYLKRQYGEDINTKNLFDDLKYIQIMYTTTPNGDHEITYGYDLENLKGIQKLDDTEIEVTNFLEIYKTREDALQQMIYKLSQNDVTDYASLDENYLNKAGFYTDNNDYVKELR